MSDPIRLAVDAMSGDFGPRTTIPAAILVARRHPATELVLLGDIAVLERHVAEHKLSLPDNLSLIHAPAQIAMGDDPRQALRLGASSSMGAALARVQSREADACISAGNSGALMLLARRMLGCVAGVDAPAFCKAMPVAQGITLMLDLGANLSCSTDKLVQFATMGCVLARNLGVAAPRVALLNIGEETGKGTQVIREAAARLQADASLDYAGFVEADDIYTGDVQVIVCDGFSGNIALKASEGVARLIAGKIQQRFRRGWWRFPALLLAPQFRRLRQDLNPDAYNGAVLAGLDGVVIKSHGGASVEAFASAIGMAEEQARAQVPAQIAASLAD